MMPYDCMISRSLSTTCIFNFPDLCPVEIKTVPCILSPADGPLIVLKQTCRHWGSRGCCSEPLGRQPEWKGRAPGDRRRINSTVQLRVTPLCVYNYVPPNTGQDPLIPPYLLSLISVAVLWQRIICLCQNAPSDFARDCATVQDMRFVSAALCFAKSLKKKKGTMGWDYKFVTGFLHCLFTILRGCFTGQECGAAEFSLPLFPWSPQSGWISCRGSFWCFRSFKWFKV